MRAPKATAKIPPALPQWLAAALPQRSSPSRRRAALLCKAAGLAAVASCLVSCGYMSHAPPSFPKVKYDDCKVWGTRGFDFLECIVIDLAGVPNDRLVLIGDDGTKIIPRDETLDSVKQRFPDATVEDRGKGRLSVSGGGLKWSFQEGEEEPQLVQALWREEWKVLNTENGRELSFPCSLKEVLHVLGRDCSATDHRGRPVELPK